MDIDIVEENLRKENCKLIAVFRYANIDFAKALENFDDDISYKYFRIKEDNSISEVKDNLLLAYLKKRNEINDENIY